MKKILLLIAAIFYTASLLAQNPSIPHLEKQENARNVTRLIVGDKPFLIRGPQNQTSVVGSSVTFQCRVGGMLSLSKLIFSGKSFE